MTSCWAYFRDSLRKIPRILWNIVTSAEAGREYLDKVVEILWNTLGRPARLIPLPVSLITVGSKLIGRPDIVQRLCGSLQVDIGKTKTLLGWMPPITVDEGLRQTAAHWIQSQ